MRARSLVVLVAMVLAAVVGAAVPGAFAQTGRTDSDSNRTSPLCIRQCIERDLAPQFRRWLFQFRG